jgi:hypothetical protein
MAGYSRHNGGAEKVVLVSPRVPPSQTQSACWIVSRISFRFCRPGQAPRIPSLRCGPNSTSLPRQLRCCIPAHALLHPLCSTAWSSPLLGHASINLAEAINVSRREHKVRSRTRVGVGCTSTRAFPRGVGRWEVGDGNWTGKGLAYVRQSQANQDTLQDESRHPSPASGAAGVTRRGRRGQTKAVCDSDDHGWGLSVTVGKLMGKLFCHLPLAVLLLATVPDQHGIAARPGQIVPPWHHPGPRDASARWNEAGGREGVWQARRGEASSVGPLVPLMLRLRGGLPESHIYAGDVGDDDAGRASGWRLRLPSAPAFNATEVGQQILSVGEELVTRYGPARGGILGCWTRTSRRQSAGSSSVVPLDAKCKTRLGFPRQILVPFYPLAPRAAHA